MSRFLTRIGIIYGLILLFAIALYHSSALLAMAPWLHGPKLLREDQQNPANVSTQLSQAQKELEAAGKSLKTAGEQLQSAGQGSARRGSPPISRSDLQKAINELRAAVDESTQALQAAKSALREAQDEEQSLGRQSNDQGRIFNLLITLTGLFIAISGFVAFKGLDATKEQAKIALETAEKQAKSVLDTAEKQTTLVVETTKLRLDATIKDVETRSASTLKEIADQQKKLTAEYPLAANLEDRLRKVAREITNNISSTVNWADSNAYESLGPERIEKLLVDEMAVAGLNIYDLGQTEQTRAAAKDIYFKLAQFYVGRANSPSNGAAAIERKKSFRSRALVYCEKAEKFSGEDTLRQAKLLRMQAVIRLGEASDSSDPKVKQQAQGVAEELLNEAEEKDRNDAGTDYNLAYIYDSQGDWQRAITVLKALVAREGSLDELQRRKYLPTACINLACAEVKLAAELIKKGDQAEAERLKSDALESLETGRALAVKYNALQQFLVDLANELKPASGDGFGGDLIELGGSHGDFFQKLLNPKITGVETADDSGAPDAARQVPYSPPGGDL